ncbi:Putative ribosomal N-acetyltransferase YdaF [Frondihabitans sp. 762G35]|uniref:GNAT family N-acetyltransferase n=1 Tax=Frondihabitans sp. 762G35 TaxID=1446794 RepID=UPI000D22B03F|nr:GNAT family protein [Frondihabitans sp. 762G35]ARC57969.1 Putative ribosomal N-acetyltransferase YdaF [Frondihabitans sp. 762G35]
MQHDIHLDGFGIRLEPVTADHASDLWALTDDELWAGMTTPRPTDPADYARHIVTQQETPGMLAFAVIDDTDGRILGSTSLYDLSIPQRRVEIGSTWYGRASWGGRTNPAAKYLLFRHAFETLGLARVALRCDARNTRSAAAIRRLGAVPEGILRAHRVAADGSRGDTAYFSVVEEEWPAVAAGLLARLAAAG